MSYQELGKSSPLKVEDVLRVSGASSRYVKIPDVRVFRTEWLVTPRYRGDVHWEQTIHASAPGVGTLRFVWTSRQAAVIYLFKRCYYIEVKARAVRGVAGPR